MNAKFAAAVVFAAAIASPVFAANSVDYGDVAPKASKVSRADVRAEVLRARAAGELDITEANFPFIIAAPKTSLTRADVRADVRRARAAGELDITEATPAFAVR